VILLNEPAKNKRKSTAKDRGSDSEGENDSEAETERVPKKTVKRKKIEGTSKNTNRGVSYRSLRNQKETHNETAFKTAGYVEPRNETMTTGETALVTTPITPTDQSLTTTSECLREDLRSTDVFLPQRP
jgi:hypothetical protein